MGWWFQRHFLAIIELDGPALPVSKQIQAEVYGWSTRWARRKAVATARMYADQYEARGQPLNQFQVVQFLEQEGSWNGPLRLVIFVLLSAAAGWLAWPHLNQWVQAT